MVLGLYQRPEQKAENQESESESHSVPSDSLRPHGLYSPWNSPGQNTGVGSCSLLQGIFPTQELNPGLLHCRQIPHQLSHQGSPRILEWVAYPFSRASSWPRNWTRVSCIAERTRDQIANIRWIMEKAREFQKNISFCFIGYAKAFDWITINCGKFWKRWEYQTTWPASWEICMQVRKQQLELDMGQQTVPNQERST